MSLLWSDAVEKHKEVLAISLDISKAFDKVWHDSLTSKLPSFSVPTVPCKWVADYLRNRSFRVVVGGCSSDRMVINAGIPQGSVLSIRSAKTRHFWV